MQSIASKVHTIVSKVHTIVVRGKNTRSSGPPTEFVTLRIDMPRPITCVACARVGAQ